MAAEGDFDPPADDAAPGPSADRPAGARYARLPLRIARIVGAAVLLLLALVVLIIGFFHSPPGRQFIVDQISSYAPASGLSVEVGEIEGSILWSATLLDVRFRDANDVLFLQVPEIDLNWRPWKFLWSGLDIRHLVLTDGTLFAAPELVPGDPDAPTLPDFDIRIDHLLIDDLTVAEGLLGEERVIDFRARTDIRDGLVFLDAKGELGGADVFTVLVHAEPDGNRFDLDLDYRAPEGGFLAALVGAEDDLALRLAGDGTWTAWEGVFDAKQGGVDLADLAIYNDGGRYRILGELRPAPFLEGLPAEALGEVVAVNATGTLEDNVLAGTFALRGRRIEADLEGAVDLAENSFDEVQVAARLIDPTLFGDDLVLDDASLRATLDGPFRDLAVRHDLRIGEVNAGGTIVQRLVQQGTLTYDGSRLTLPVNASVQRVVSGNRIADPRLVNGRIGGALVLEGNRLRSDALAVRFPGLSADLALEGDLARNVFGLNGPVSASGLTFEGIGTVDARARIRLAVGGAPWRLSADLAGRVREVSNPTLANLAGEDISFSGALSLGEARPIVFDNARLTASKLTLELDGRVADGATTLTGSGEHVDYGAFTVEATMAAEGPRAVLVFADPLPAAGLRDVRVALAPNANGFTIETEGGSLLGPFEGLVNLVIPDDGDVRIGIERLDVSSTRLSGDLALAQGGVAGTLRLERGGVDGTLALSTRNGGQAFDADLRFANARFGGATPIAINQGTFDASGFIGGGNTTIEGETRISGLGYGSLFLRRVAAQARIANGRGTFDGAIAGQRGSRFELLVNGQVAPDRIAVALKGEYAGRDITMPRRAVLTRTEDGGWRLARTQLGYGDGYTIVEGRFGGEAAAEAAVNLSEMPLSLVDALGADLGLGGTVSGVVELGAALGGQPIGSARIKVEDLTRSGLVLSSRPIDLALVADLSPSLLQARAVMNGGSAGTGRLHGGLVPDLAASARGDEWRLGGHRATSGANRRPAPKRPAGAAAVRRGPTGPVPLQGARRGALASGGARPHRHQRTGERRRGCQRVAGQSACPWIAGGR